MEICTLKKRKDFVRAASKGQRVTSRTVTILAAQNKSAQDLVTYVGYTTTKKLGKAHIRNFARRRLRAIVREIFPHYALNGFTYVLIGRYSTAGCPFDELRKDALYAVKKLTKTFRPQEDTANEPAVPPADSQH